MIYYLVATYGDDPIFYSKQIRFENRNIGTNPQRVCKLSLDCTDYLMDEPQPFSSKKFSQKFNHSALRYEIGVALYSSNIAWASGPHLPGVKNDLEIYRECLKHALVANKEMAYADGGYKGEMGTIQEKGRGSTDERAVATLARARHETFNRRMKEWNSLKHSFRHNHGHNVSNHGYVFNAVVVVTQLSVMWNHSLFDL